ncbi:MAG: hypothetical protein PHI48_13625 [Bacteroidales bacterium]|nr:hypothetical protein [Bacteroidales bacterium]
MNRRAIGLLPPQVSGSELPKVVAGGDGLLVWVAALLRQALLLPQCLLLNHCKGS